MNVFERLKKIRKYRELTQEDMAKVFKISGASYGRKEKGSEGGLGPAEIKLFLEKTQIDPRYLFGLTDDIEEADLVKNPVSRSLREEIQGLKEAFNKKIPDTEKDDPLISAFIL